MVQVQKKEYWRPGDPGSQCDLRRSRILYKGSRSGSDYLPSHTCMYMLLAGSPVRRFARSCNGSQVTRSLQSPCKGLATPDCSVGPEYSEPWSGDLCLPSFCISLSFLVPCSTLSLDIGSFVFVRVREFGCGGGVCVCVPVLCTVKVRGVYMVEH